MIYTKKYYFDKIYGNLFENFNSNMQYWIRWDYLVFFSDKNLFDCLKSYILYMKKLYYLYDVIKTTISHVIECSIT